MQKIVITEHDDGEQIEVETQRSHYHCSHDEHTGDWIVFKEGGFNTEYVHSRGDAIKLVLAKTGVLPDAEPKFSPDRTSA